MPLVTKVDEVFVIRFWQERGSEDDWDADRWRVRIRHANSRRQFDAVGLKGALNIVRDALSEDGANRKKSV